MRQTQAGLIAIRQIFALLIGLGLLAIGLMFSLVILAVLAVVGTLGFAWFWWRTRALRAALREQAAMQTREGRASGDTQGAMDPAASGTVIDGEAVVVEEAFTATRDRLPPPMSGR